MKIPLFIPFFATILFAFNSYGQDGAGIFKKNCGACHTIGHGKIVGPDLNGADKKHDIKWMTEWIKSSQTMINVKKDPAAIQLFNDNNKMVMTDQPLTDDEIKTVVAYIGDESAKLQTSSASANTTAAPSTTSAATSVMSQSTPASSTGISSKTLNYILIGIITFLTIILIGLGMIIKTIAKNSGKRV